MSNIKQAAGSSGKLPAYALDLSAEGLTLYRRRRNGKWDVVTSAGLAVGSVGRSLKTLHDAARYRGPGHVPIEVWLPPDQVTVRIFEGAQRPIPAFLDAEFQHVSPDGSGFTIDHRAAASGNTFPVAVVPTTTLTETRDFLEPHGFKIETFTLQERPLGLEHRPVFVLPRAGALDVPRVAAVAAAAVLVLSGIGWFGWQIFGNPGGAPRDVATLSVQQVALAPGQGIALEGGGPLGPSATRTVAPDPLALNAIATAPEPFLPPQYVVATEPTLIQVTSLITPAEIPEPPTVAPLAAVGPTDIIASISADDSIPPLPAIFSAPVQVELALLTTPKASMPPDVIAPLAPVEPLQVFANIATESTVPPLPAIFTAPVQTRVAALPQDEENAAEVPLPSGLAPHAESPDQAPRSAAPLAALNAVPISPQVASITREQPTRVTTGSRVQPQLAAPGSTGKALAPPGSETAVARMALSGLNGTIAPPPAPQRVAALPQSPAQPVTDAVRRSDGNPVSVARDLPPKADRSRGLARPGNGLPSAPDLPDLRETAPNPRGGAQTIVAALPDSKDVIPDAPTITVRRDLPEVMPPTRPAGTLAPVPVETVRPDIVPPLRDATPDQTLIGPPLPPTVTVIAALPSIVPPRRPVTTGGPAPERASADSSAVPDAAAPDIVLTPLSDEVAALIAAAEADTLEPSALALTQADRPRQRPAALAEAEAQRLAALVPSERALSQADRPSKRPAGFAPAQPAPPPEAPATVAATPDAASVPTTTAPPPLPTTASVARAATVKNAMPLRKMALIGVFEGSGNRHALVRLPSGRYLKVEQGDRVDGFNVAAISSDAIRLRRGGRERLLVIP
ncbi:MAG: hypothetical protein AAGB10_08130 [Pseudomonadota bacterium]